MHGKAVPRMLTAVLANCGDSGSPQMKQIYFTNEQKAKNWSNDKNNSHRFAKLNPSDPSDSAVRVVTTQVEAWRDENGKYFLNKGEAGFIEVTVVS
jgi:hypothetical protein